MKPSRAMISGELAFSYIALCFAIAGSGLPPFGAGQLYYAIRDHASPLMWSLSLGIPAVLLMIAGIREWCAHTDACSKGIRRWNVFEMDRSAIWRGRLCLCLILGWGYMFKVLVNDLHRVSALSLVAIGGVVFMWWFYKENRRVRREIRGNTVVGRVPAQG